eukprot:m.254615 g.254615  ORF g.254615 m.254615 type:complete len:61 (+) comp19606_c0_seq1:338-520(+)
MDPTERYTIEDLSKHPLLQFTPAVAQRALVDEIKVRVSVHSGASTCQDFFVVITIWLRET